MGTKEELEGFIDRLRFAPAGYKSHTVFIDEASRLSKPAADLLLKPIEDSDAVIFIFALIDDAALPGPLQQRCTPLRLQPLTVEQKVSGLERIVRAESLTIEPGALTLIAQQSNGLRQATSALQEIGEYVGKSQSVTADVVSTSLYFANSTAVVKFLSASLAGDVATVWSSMERMDAEPVNRFRDVQRLLLYIKQSYDNPIFAHNDASGLLYRRESVESLFRQLLLNADRLQLSLRAYLDLLLEHYEYIPPITAETFAIHAARFGDLCAGLWSDGALSPLEQLAALPRVDKLDSARHRRPRTTYRRHALPVGSAR